jgi:23S rRNA pseudouridine2604 synthase
MATLKLKKKPAPSAEHDPFHGNAPARAPVRGVGAVKRPRTTATQAQAAAHTRAEGQPPVRDQHPPVHSQRPTQGRQPVQGQRPVRGPDQAQAWNAFGEPDKKPPSSPASGPRRPPLSPARPRSAPEAPVVRPEAPASAHNDGSLRLSKRMAELGLASRREADEWIARGWVWVDGQVVNTLGARVRPEQHIQIAPPARQQQAQRVTVLLNKPVGYVSGQAEDGYEPAFVLVKPANQWTQDQSGIRYSRDHLRHLVPAGRLDIDSVGLLVLTQDGRMARQLIGADRSIEKEYLVRVKRIDGGRLPDSELALLRHGMELDGEPLRPAVVEWVNEDQLRFVLTEGKKRQIRRMCEGVGLDVLGLKRVRIGRVMLGDLPAGQWRYLRPDEAF